MQAVSASRVWAPTMMRQGRACFCTSGTLMQQQRKPTAGTSSATSARSGSSSVAEPPSNVFKKAGGTKDLGPGASKEGKYKNPEYFQYHSMSYAEMDVVMSRFRLAQPSSSPKK